MEEASAIILAPGISFVDWKSALQAALIKKGRLAHVFHNLDEIKPATRPTEPTEPDAMNKYYEALAKWKEGEIEAKNVLLRQLSPSVRPQNSDICQSKKFLTILHQLERKAQQLPTRRL